MSVSLEDVLAEVRAMRIEVAERLQAQSVRGVQARRGKYITTATAAQMLDADNPPSAKTTRAILNRLGVKRAKVGREYRWNREQVERKLEREEKYWPLCGVAKRAQR